MDGINKACLNRVIYLSSGLKPLMPSCPLSYCFNHILSVFKINENTSTTTFNKNQALVDSFFLHVRKFGRCRYHFTFLLLYYLQFYFQVFCICTKIYSLSVSVTIAKFLSSLVCCLLFQLLCTEKYSDFQANC